MARNTPAWPSGDRSYHFPERSSVLRQFECVRKGDDSRYLGNPSEAWSSTRAPPSCWDSSLARRCQYTPGRNSLRCTQDMAESTDAASSYDGRQSGWLSSKGVEPLVVNEVIPSNSQYAADAFAVESINQRARGSAQRPSFASIQKDGDHYGV